MKRRYFKIINEVLLILFIVISLLTIAGKRIYLPMNEPDEAGWIYSGYYFNFYSINPIGIFYLVGRIKNWHLFAGELNILLILGFIFRNEF